MKKILVKNEYLIVDDEDFQRVSKHKWYISKISRCKYALRHKKRKERVSCKTLKIKQKQKYILKNGTKKEATYIIERIPLHWFILNYAGDLVIDHINGNGLDNRKTNLRMVTQQSNLQNRKVNLNSKTGVRCIYKDSNDGKYVVDIQRNKIRYRKRGFKSLNHARDYLSKQLKFIESS